MSKIQLERTRQLNDYEIEAERRGPVIYWMERDQRAHDNWALLYAQQLAANLRRSIEVIFCLTTDRSGTTERQQEFMMSGLQELERELRRHEIPLVLLMGEPAKEITRYIEGVHSPAVVTDFSSLRAARRWRSKIAERISCPLVEVDTRNIVPCWEASDKREYAAYTFRPKVKRKLAEFLAGMPRLRHHQAAATAPDPDWIDWDKAREAIGLSASKLAYREIPGEKAAARLLERFITGGIEGYAANRNDPNAEAQSGLSPYLHFGHISAQRVAWEIQQRVDPAAAEVFLEELIVRRELSDNYCFYCEDYDSAEAFPDWALKTLDEHRQDPRKYLYSPDQIEAGETHDPLWNAAQRHMVISGSMPGYLRMYWAKKILEWSPDHEQALQTAIELNDRYELDGRDPNGYAGVAWSIGGVHDRAWPEREIFGKIRYMSYDGCRRKFDVDAYVGRVKQMERREY